MMRGMTTVRCGKSGLARWVVAAWALLMLFGPMPAYAQKMHDDGMAIPWFRSQAENRARQACEDDLPECRGSVRAQLEFEHAITRTLPWVLVALAAVGVLIYARAKEQQREKKRREAQRHHEINRHRANAEAEKVAAVKDDEDADDDDDMGMSKSSPSAGTRRRR